MKHRLFLAPLALLLAGAAQATPNDPAPLDAILKAIVKDGGVDYALLRDKHLPALDAWLASFKDTGELPLADLINLYNAHMLKAVVEKRAGDPAWKPSDGNYGVFKEPRVRLASGVVSLDHLENQVIRKRGDPRIHAALNCAAASCPPLIPEAYRQETLDRQLEENMRAFVNDPTRNRFDARTRTLEISSIFNWFAADFGGPEKVPAYLAKYRPGNYQGWTVKFADYDWKLNERK